jgi:predicted phosphodiesterase
MRSDLHCLGTTEGAIEICNQTLFLHHGDGKNDVNNPPGFFAYNLAKSRGLKNIKAVLVGHFHSYSYYRDGGTVVITLPGFQYQPPYIREKCEVGGIILTCGEDRTTDIEYFPYNKPNWNNHKDLYRS